MSQNFVIAITQTVENVTATLDEVFNLLWTNSLLNSNVLIQAKRNFWTLYTFMPYRRDCFTLSHVLIETFTPYNFTNNMTTNLSMSMEELYREKLHDFNMCPLYVASSLIDPFAIEYELNGRKFYKGIDISIVMEISRALNFDIFFKRASNLSGHGILLPNGTFTENLGLVNALVFNSYSIDFMRNLLVLNRCMMER